MFGLILSALCYFGGSFAPNYMTYSCLRLLSVTVGFIATFGLYAIMIEIVSTKYRRHVGLIRDLRFFTGNAIVGIFGYFIRDWRTLQLALRFIDPTCGVEGINWRRGLSTGPLLKWAKNFPLLAENVSTFEHKQSYYLRGR